MIKRPSPSVSAQLHKNKILIGNDKQMYKSMPNVNNIYRWVLYHELLVLKPITTYQNYTPAPKNNRYSILLGTNKIKINNEIINLANVPNIIHAHENYLTLDFKHKNIAWELSFKITETLYKKISYLNKISNEKYNLEPNYIKNPLGTLVLMTDAIVKHMKPGKYLLLTGQNKWCVTKKMYLDTLIVERIEGDRIIGQISMPTKKGIKFYDNCARDFCIIYRTKQGAWGTGTGCDSIYILQ
jgi:hypothetical protein